MESTYRFKEEVDDRVEVLLIVAGSALFSTAINLFVVPLGLYNPGCTGIAQLIRSILVERCGMAFPFDVAGIVNLLLNIPLALLAWRGLSRRFLVGTILSVLVQTAAFTFVPIPTVPIVSDVAVSCAIGAALSATGIGLTLMAGCSGGGTDIIGMYLSVTREHFSVGKLTLMVNVGIYLTCAMLFDLQTALYSVFYAVIFSVVLDRVHLQNRETYCMVFTRSAETRDLIVHKIHRGLTWWHGVGGFSDQPIDVLVTVASKKEVPNLARQVKTQDPGAFVIEMEDVHVVGNFEKRLVR
jgi:uncharacterized membrane-anchored protein YitT (DUF2179 family)